MKYKTIELDGPLLDAAVAQTLGLRYVLARTMMDIPGPYRCTLLDTGELFGPSRRWSDGGPIIEREKITLLWREHNGMMETGYWAAMKDADLLQPGSGLWMVSPSLLVAAMLAFVVAKLGAEIEMPS